MFINYVKSSLTSRQSDWNRYNTISLFLSLSSVSLESVLALSSGFSRKGRNSGNLRKLQEPEKWDNFPDTEAMSVVRYMLFEILLLYWYSNLRSSILSFSSLLAILSFSMEVVQFVWIRRREINVENGRFENWSLKRKRLIRKWWNP